MATDEKLPAYRDRATARVILGRVAVTSDPGAQFRLIAKTPDRLVVICFFCALAHGTFRSAGVGFRKLAQLVDIPDRKAP